MVMMEASEKEDAPPLPLPLPLTTFSAPFAAPSLRWPAKKRLRCFSPDAPSASSSLRFSPSRSPLRRISPPHDGASNSMCIAASSETPPSPSPPPPQQQQQDAPSRTPGSPLPPRSPTPSDRPRVMIRLRKARREGSPRDEDWEPPPAPPTDLSSAVPTGTARGWEGEAAGRTLRSSSRLAGEEEEKTGKRKGRVELWVTLSKTEVEEDFLRMTGYKPPRRCRLGRRKLGPDYLSRVFPGSWLPNRITADWYKVAEPSNPKEVCNSLVRYNRKGLKASSWEGYLLGSKFPAFPPLLNLYAIFGHQDRRCDSRLMAEREGSLLANKLVLWLSLLKNSGLSCSQCKLMETWFIHQRKVPMARASIIGQEVFPVETDPI
ncbi:hypothetical protein Taro_006711 [Colocasia esculenta]|uniref:Uncharacterized protein n=1 Tax=Colocasia esculenta TaxID=4460 RepID=A0A843TYD1_COLES|nr:hypothetical protein [Colocasia esculenta]